MNVLIVGAAGHVGGILRPSFEATHSCRYLDLRPVDGAEDRSVVGTVTDPAAVAVAMAGIDACVQLAMFPARAEADRVDGSYDVHVKGMHRLLEAAVAHGCRKVVYASTLSVYRGSRPRNGLLDETVPPDACDLYGLTKRLGEQVCEAFARRHTDLSVLALQLVGPRSEAQWAQEDRHGPGRNFRTGPEDLRRAFLSAVGLPDHHGYDAVFICSDLEREFLDLGKARRLLGWAPEGR